MASTNLATESCGKVNTRFSLVNNLLEHPDQVATILQDNEDIIDYALVQLLENISEYKRIQNCINTANFLIDVTEQIQRELNVSSIAGIKKKVAII